MSYNDKTPSKSDKITSFLKETPASSCTTIWNFLKKTEPSLSRRTVQRRLSHLIHEGIVESHSIGREIVYSLRKSEISNITNYFLSRFWSEFFKINEMLHEGYPYYLKAFLKLRSLITLLPKDLREKLEPDFERVSRDVNWSMETLVRGGQRSFAELKRDQELIMLELMRKVSAAVHDRFEPKPIHVADSQSKEGNV